MKTFSIDIPLRLRLTFQAESVEAAERLIKSMDASFVPDGGCMEWREIGGEDATALIEGITSTGASKDSAPRPQVFPGVHGQSQTPEGAIRLPPQGSLGVTPSAPPDPEAERLARENEELRKRLGV